MDKKAYTAYEARLKYIIDEEAAIRAAELREIAAGEKGREEGLVKFIRNLYNRGISIAEIAELGQLEVAEVKELIDKYDLHS